MQYGIPLSEDFRDFEFEEDEVDRMFEHSVREGRGMLQKMKLKSESGCVGFVMETLFFPRQDACP